MIARLRGELIEADGGEVVIDCGGVGYCVHMPLPSATSLGTPGIEVSVYVHTSVSQDSIALFGFASGAERELFRVLIGVNGVGPRMALSILSTIEPSALGEIVAVSDRAALQRVPGIGAKKAARLLLELKDRLPVLPIGTAKEVDESADGTRRAVSRAVGGGLQADLISALTNLGFREIDAGDLARATVAAYPDERRPAELIRRALQRTTH